MRNSLLLQDQGGVFVQRGSEAVVDFILAIFGFALNNLQGVRSTTLHNCLFGSRVGRCWLLGWWVIGWLVWLAGWLAGCLVGLVGWLVWLAGCLVWLAGEWLGGWLVSWLVG